MSCHEHYRQINRSRVTILGIGAAVLCLALLTDLHTGASHLTFTQMLQALLAGPDSEDLNATILWQIRLPMVLTALFVGACLALAGLQIQNITQNALASPSTLGMTSAASFGAAWAISLGLTVSNTLWISTAVGALTFCLFVGAAIFFLAARRAMSPQTIILAGIVMNFFFMALQQLLVFRASPEIAQLINGWTFGNLERATWASVAASGSLCLAASLYFIPRSWALTALALGKERAQSLGINVARVRIETFLLAALLVAAAVAFVGPIGFVGLVAPHLAKLLLGEDQRFLLPGTLIAGGLLMSASSVLAKLISTSAAMPVGIITSLIGVPCLLMLLVRLPRRTES